MAYDPNLPPLPPVLADEVKLQAFVDSACTEWLPDGGYFLGLSDVEAGKAIKSLVQDQIKLGNTARQGRPWPESRDGL